MNSKWVKINLIYFFIIALLGILIRVGFFNGNFAINYKHMLHTHSHIAFLGWIYPILFISIVDNFLSKEKIIKGKYHLQFIITQIIIALMLISFLLQGYGLFSIIFSSIFQFMTYWFSFKIFKDWKDISNKYSVKFIKTGLLALIISSLGTWSLAVISAKGMAGSDIYEMAIYFYLHFQYNGWFTFAILGLLTDIIEKRNIKIPIKFIDLSYKLLAFSLFPAYFLSTLGKVNNNFISFIASISGVVQLAGASLFLVMLFKVRKELGQLFQGYTKVLMFISLSAFLMKNILQLMSVFPSLTDIAFNNRYIVIAYIHMIFIGFVSFFIFGYLGYFKLYDLKTTISKLGLNLLITGFCITEVLLITPGLNIFITNLSLLILLFSCVMGTGLFLFIINQFRLKKNLYKLYSSLTFRYKEELINYNMKNSFVKK